MMGLSRTRRSRGISLGPATVFVDAGHKPGTPRTARDVIGLSLEPAGEPPMTAAAFSA